jgi:hypothetical protein
MRLICIGDVALADINCLNKEWPLPAGISADNDTRVLLNWELPIGDLVNRIPRSSGPRLIVSSNSLIAFQKWSPGFATVATNHILDAGEEGVERTTELLRSCGFQTVGGGRTPEEISRPLLWETAEGCLAIINWVFPETHPDWMAVPGPNCWPGIETASRLVQEIKRIADWVMVVVHWSDELFGYPRPEDRRIARDLVRMGAGVVIGHHPHVVRGMELFDACPVFYSTGNFYFSNFPDDRGGWIVQQAPRNREGLGVHLTFRRNRKPEYKALSFYQYKNISLSDSLNRASKRMEKLSRPLQRLHGSEYEAWYSIQRRRFDRWGGMWDFGVRRVGIFGTIRYAINRLRASGG